MQHKLIETGKTIATRQSRAHCETANAYNRVILRRGRYRVAACRDGLQWLFQQRVTTKPCAGAGWRSVGYCTTRKALVRLQHRFVGVSWPELETLPERFKWEGQA
ncbi:MAG: hypothetical protein IME92_09885 [Proteobacteria bacterium]|nr:hypothetical protein [Pseudomonadota bacterium]